MYHFTIENIESSSSGCHKCCCEKMALKPGTTTKVSVGYAPWAMPIGELHCTPQFAIEQMETCPTSPGPPVATGDVKFSTPMNTLLEGDLGTLIVDPDNSALTFKPLQLYGPKHGKLDLDASGVFDYQPASGFTGEERFYVSVSDNITTVIFEVMIAVGIDAATMAHTPHISVGPATIDQRYFMASFPVTVSPAAQLCEVWRLTVLQAALDCDCTCYTRTDCFDIGIAKC
jgi:VCBS repeat-containing protein